MRKNSMIKFGQRQNMIYSEFITTEKDVLIKSIETRQNKMMN